MAMLTNMAQSLQGSFAPSGGAAPAASPVGQSSQFQSFGIPGGMLGAVLRKNPQFMQRLQGFASPLPQSQQMQTGLPPQPQLAFNPHSGNVFSGQSVGGFFGGMMTEDRMRQLLSVYNQSRI